ncbi:MAG TPA: NAD-dependent epimerase/dehydratase family protein [Gaiellaceae bacterium]|jgi:nucleoside-diphosphate-sugar epimerase
MRFLVLGGTQFIGPHVARLLASWGHDVTVFHRGQTETELPEGARHVHGDFADLEERVSELSGTGLDVVIDMVPWIAKSGRQGVMWFKGIAQRGLVVTSGDVYRAFGRLWRSEPGPPDPVPLSEDSPLRERPAPDRAGTTVDFDNAETEDLVTCDPDLPVTVLRLPATYGPGDAQHRLYGYVRRMEDRRPVILLDERLAGWRWSRGYVEDVAAAIALAAADARATGRVYNVAQPEAYSEEAWVRLIANVHGWHGRVVAVPGEAIPESLRWEFDTRQEYVMDSTRIRAELGYAEEIPLSEGLRRTIDWERANPPPEIQLDYEAEDRAVAELAT